MCDLSFEKTGSVLDNDQACEQLTSLEPVIPSSALSFSQAYKEESQEEVHMSLTSTIFYSEQQTSLLFEANLGSVHLENPQEHCKEIDLVTTEPSLFVMISAQEEKRFGLEKLKEIYVSKSVLDIMITTFDKLTLETVLRPKLFITNELHELHYSLSVSKFNDLLHLIRARNETALFNKTFSNVKQSLNTGLSISESLYECGNHVESVLNVLGHKSVFRYHNELFKSSCHTFDVFALVFVKVDKGQVKDVVSNTMTRELIYKKNGVKFRTNLEWPSFKSIKFKWKEKDETTCHLEKEKFTSTLVLYNFFEYCKHEYYASRIGIGTILMQDQRRETTYSEKGGGELVFPLGAKEKHEYFGEWIIKEKPPYLHWSHSIYKDFKQGTMSRAEQRNIKASSIFKDEPPDATCKPKEEELVTNNILIQEEPPDPIPLTLMISSFEHIKDLLQVSNSLTGLVPHNLETVIMSLLLPEHVKKKLDLFKDDSELISCFRKEKHGKYNVVIQADTCLFVYNNSMTAIIHLLFAKGVAYIAGVKEEPPDLEVLSSNFYARTGIGVVLTKTLCQSSVRIKLFKKFGILSKPIKESYCDIEPHLKLHKTNAQSSDLRGKHSVTLFFDDSNLLLFVADDPDLRSNLFQEGGDDMSMESSKELEPEDELEAEEALLVPAGPMTRSRANAFNKALGGLLDTFWKQMELLHNFEDNANQTTLVSVQAQ